MSLQFSGDSRDGNEPGIIARLRGLGAMVVKLSGRDVPDLLVAWRGRAYLAEVKQAKGKLTSGQEQWHRLWRGPKVAVLRKAEDVDTWLGALDEDDMGDGT